MRNTASPRTKPKRDRESTASDSAPMVLRPRARLTPSSTAALARIRRQASPISRMSSERMDDVIAEAARTPAARAGAAA